MKSPKLIMMVINPKVLFILAGASSIIIFEIGLMDIIDLKMYVIDSTPYGFISALKVDIIMVMASGRILYL